MMKQVSSVFRAPSPHWVGDGFPVRSLFQYGAHGAGISPFLLLDHAGPVDFDPTEARRGVGPHPHRGIETVTIVYQGEVAHRDSTGQGGVIGPGDVQWMTAAAGIVHEEYHADEFARRGGAFEMVQLWVNLPARDKMAAPGYQLIGKAEIPEVALPHGAGTLRVIAGAHAGRAGPAHTFSPMNVWDLRLTAGGEAVLDVPEGHIAIVVVLRGAAAVGGTHELGASQVALLDRTGSEVRVTARTEALLLVLTGEPLDEPIVGHGPFVMNTEAEIHQAYADFRAGRLGALAPEAAALAV